ncbi:MAG: hypothetical protein KAR20_23170, partial [Candidatus Heimdallarchaeota archaeon]|nr:hypothetical protein [Candidatus Heimdallarchaeota archaeon]
MQNSSNNKTNNQSDWYQKILAQALVPMTLRVGCFHLNRTSRFDLYADKDGGLQNLVLEISSCVDHLSKQTTASSIYSDETPIIRFISRQAMDISPLENVQIENMTIAMLSESEAFTKDFPEDTIYSEKENHPKNASIQYSAEVISGQNHSDFIFGQIASHSDLLIIDASDSSDFTLNEFVSRNLCVCETICIVIVRNNEFSDFIATNSSEIEHCISGEILAKKLSLELSEILLFNSLLEGRN